MLMLRALTAASVMTASDGSLTRPVRLDVLTCASAAAPENASVIQRSLAEASNHLTLLAALLRPCAESISHSL